VDEGSAKELFRHKVLALLRRRGLLSLERIELLLSWRRSGFSVHNRVYAHPGDGRDFEALVRYMMRSPVSLSRLRFTRGAKEVVYTRKGGHDASEPGEDERVDAEDFVARVLVQIPDPRRHLVRHYGGYGEERRGVLGERSRWRVSRRDGSRSWPTGRRCWSDVTECAAMRTIIAALLLSFPTFADAEAPNLPRSAPEAQGISSSSILTFVEKTEAEIDSLHSLMVLRHGNVVAEGWWEPYRREDPHVLFSLSKSFTSTGVGLAIAEGKLSLDDTVLSFFPEEAPEEPSENLKAMRVRDLLSMNTGHHEEAIQGFSYGMAGDPGVTEFLALPVAHKPGTHFVYNTPASFMLSAIVQKVTGTPLVDYLGPRLFGPLGIATPRWDANTRGVSLGGFGLHLTTEDIARFGQLYLQRGRWNGEQILPEAWVAAATARQVSNGSSPDSDWEQGYGYQFWRCRHGQYRGDGAFGQYCIVMPEQDAVVAITSGVGDMQAVLNLVWEHLLGGMKDGALPADDGTRERLEKKMASLRLPPPAASAASPVAAAISGNVYVLPENDGEIEAVSLEVGEETTLVLRIDGRDWPLACGSGEWRVGGRLPFGGRAMARTEEPVAATGAWTDDATYTAKACFHKTPFCATYELEFEGDVLLFDAEMNVGFGPTERPLLIGRQEP
jgi:CubicO group peptidase (beta-lactamase class C family)